ncbi:hypothetical protein F4821DRAFT_33672 [Hypoxylon rubiginosum]|uniref:Uncharacterized protein n=1 Tax=Hypoxylon rubiginosum TaxID=110542 RepID=A0ACC0CLG5_9PEZI|nr:hypothetical protein F4821DRAFT_33672 [Hypoxylon rubiginosum]
MRPTYEKANAVLVLDSWIIEETHQDKLDTENLHKIFFCAWNTRLWTFQEGALAQTLLFQFHDGAYDVDEAIERIKASKDSKIEVTVKPSLIGLHDQLRGFRKCDGSNNDLLRFIAKSLAVRSTSMSEDEPLCLAALLDLDVKKIAETESDLRMQEFWRMLDPIPASFIFKSRYKKINIDGFRWAPKSLLEVGNYPIYLHSPGLLRLGEEGLLAIGPGLKFPDADVDIQKSIWLTDGRSNWCRLDLFLEDCSEAIEFELPDSSLRSRFINVKKAYDCNEVGFIFERKLLGDDKSPQDLDPHYYNRDVIAMIAIKHDKGGRIYGRFVCGGIIQKVGPDVYRRNGDVLQQFFEKEKIRISPQDLERLDIRPDNTQLNFQAPNLSFEQILGLARMGRIPGQGVLTVTQYKSRFSFDRRSEKLVGAICQVTSANQKWCIG